MARINVRYKGIADRRILSVKDLKNAGIENLPEKDLVWERGNLFQVEMDADDKMEELLRREGHFRIEKAKDDGGTEVESDATDPNKEGDILVDGDTGASTPAGDWR